MHSVHPTETADSGKLQYQSFYIKKSDTPDRIILCGQCGFPVDLKTRATGDSYGAVGNPTLITDSGAAVRDGIAFTNTTGDPPGTTGCPLCGTLNPQAKGRGKSAFDRPRHSILGL